MPDRWIVISLDAFANLAIGAYGSSWNTTPNIDGIAARGITWDRAVMPFDDTVQTLRDCWSAPSGDAGDAGWIAQCQKHGRVELILGDDPAGRDQSSAIARLAGEVGFDRCTMVEVSLGEEPSEEIESTAIAELFAALVERLQEVAEADESGSATGSPWSVLWLHSDLLARHWDAPRWLFPVDEPEEEAEAAGELEEDEYEDGEIEESEVEVDFPTIRSSGSSLSNRQVKIFGRRLMRSTCCLTRRLTRHWKSNRSRQRDRLNWSTASRRRVIGSHRTTILTG